MGVVDEHLQKNWTMSWLLKNKKIKKSKQNKKGVQYVEVGGAGKITFELELGLLAY